jgi:hypothetical protein
VNFVILDWEMPEDKRLAMDLGLNYHPRFATLKPNSDELVDGLYAAPRSGELRAMIEDLLDEHGGG